MALRDQPVQVILGALHRHAAHRDVVAGVLAALGEHDAERARGDFRVLEEQLVEVAHPVEQQQPRIGRLDFEVLLHHRRDAPGSLGSRWRHARWSSMQAVPCAPLRDARADRSRHPDRRAKWAWELSCNSTVAGETRHASKVHGLFLRGERRLSPPRVRAIRRQFVRFPPTSSAPVWLWRRCRTYLGAAHVAPRIDGLGVRDVLDGRLVGLFGRPPFFAAASGETSFSWFSGMPVPIGWA